MLCVNVCVMSCIGQSYVFLLSQGESSEGIYNSFFSFSVTKKKPPFRYGMLLSPFFSHFFVQSYLLKHSLLVLTTVSVHF